MPGGFWSYFPSWPELVMKIARAIVIALTFEVFTFIAARRMEAHLRDVFACDAHRDPSRRSRRRSKLRAAVRAACRAVFYPLAFLVMLEIFGVPANSLAAAYVSAVVIAVTAGRAWMQDVVAGVLLLGEDQFAVGDEVRLNDTLEGSVERMTLRATWVKSGAHVHVLPNRSITSVRVAAREPKPI